MPSGWWKVVGELEGGREKGLSERDEEAGPSCRGQSRTLPGFWWRQEVLQKALPSTAGHDPSPEAGGPGGIGRVMMREDSGVGGLQTLACLHIPIAEGCVGGGLFNQPWEVVVDLGLLGAPLPSPHHPPSISELCSDTLTMPGELQTPFSPRSLFSRDSNGQTRYTTLSKCQKDQSGGGGATAAL